MHVDDRIRQGLEANATSIASSSEWRLEQVHRRRRRRTTNVAVSVAASVAALAAGVVVQLGGISPLGSSTPAADDCPSVLDAGGRACDRAPGSFLSAERPTSADGAVPVGGWLREVTAKRGLALGISRRRVERLTGEDGVLGLGLRVDQQVFGIYVNDDDGRATLWDTGGYEFRPGHRLVLTSMSNKCPGCITTLTWRQLGEDVAFASVTRDRAGLLARWFYEGRWNFG